MNKSYLIETSTKNECRWVILFLLITYFNFGCEGKKKKDSGLKKIEFALDTISLGEINEEYLTEGVDFSNMASMSSLTDHNGDPLIEKIAMVEIPVYLPLEFVNNGLNNNEDIFFIPNKKFYSASQKNIINGNEYVVEIFGTKVGYEIYKLPLDINAQESNSFEISDSEEGVHISFSRHGIPYRMSISCLEAEDCISEELIESLYESLKIFNVEHFNSN